MVLSRRQFVRAGTAAGLGLAGTGLVGAMVARAFSPDGTPTVSDPLAGRHGFQLPPGFRVRLIARSGDPIGDTGYVMHKKPDGASCFPKSDGGWLYVSNSEAANFPDAPNEGGGVGVIRFDAAGNVVAARRLLGGTTANCAGGATPWGTWLSCEETQFGRVWEVDPTSQVPPRALDSLGWFAHEGAAVDAARGHVYLTEDKRDSLLYRAVYTTPGDLSVASLEAAVVDAGGSVTWKPVPAPNPTGGVAEVRLQVPTATVFDGAEGIDIHNDILYFDTKNDGVIWRLNLKTQRLDSLYHQYDYADPPLRGIDTLILSRSGRMFVCEDHQAGPLNLVAFSPNGTIRPFLRLTGHETSELTGVAFNPAETRMYIASQRGIDGSNGLLYEISGPFAAWMAAL